MYLDTIESLQTFNVQSLKKKKKNPINSNSNYRREMELQPVNMDYWLL